MAISKKKRLEIEHRRLQVSELGLKGYSQTAIAKQLSVTQATVSNDLKAIREEWRASTIRDFDQNISIELERLNLIEREMWEAWERSKRPSQSAVLIGEGGTLPARKTLKNQNGDPRYLMVALRCHQCRRALLALDPPKRSEATHAEGRKLTLLDVLNHIEKNPPSPPEFIDPHPSNVIDVDDILRQMDEMPPEPAHDEPQGDE
jgi:hypothetical protein